MTLRSAWQGDIVALLCERVILRLANYFSLIYMHNFYHFAQCVVRASSGALLLSTVMAIVLQVPKVQAAEIGLPGVGALLNGGMAPPPVRVVPNTTLPSEATSAELVDDSIPIAVRDFTLTGNTVFEEAQLRPLLAHLRGGTWTLVQLMQAIQSISDFYALAGYPLVSVTIPEQTLDDEVLQLEILEGVWGDILIENPGKRSDRLLRLATKNLGKGQPILQRDIDHSTALLSDIAGLTVRARLRPGENYGSSNLVVSAEAASPLVGDISINNFGGAATGRTQANLSLQFNGLATLGDTTSVDALSSGDGLNWLRTSAELPLDWQAVRLGAAYSSVRYQLGGEAASLNAHGWARQSSLWIRHSLIQLASTYMNARVQFDKVDLDDLVGIGAQSGNPRSIEMWGLALGADILDSWHLGGRTRMSLGVIQGQLQFHSEIAQANDAALARTEGRFLRLNLAGAHTRDLTSVYSLNASFDAQLADNNLDASQKASLGGARNVRGFEPGALSSDTRIALAIELKRTLGEWHGVQWSTLLFADYGWAKFNTKPWTTADNEASVASVGLALQGVTAKQWRFNLSLADMVGGLPSALQGSQARHYGVWLELGKSISF